MRSVEDRFIFFPTRQLIGSPFDLGLDFESVHLTTEDGTRLHGWWVPAKPERAVVLFLHGNAGNISDRLESISAFHDLDLSVFIFDYRGYGQSEGVPSETGTYRDAEAAWQYLTKDRRIAENRIVVFGRSLGGAVAAELATHHSPKALILESTFSSIADMASASMPFLPIGRLLRTRYDTESKIERVSSPVLVVHSREDEIVPFTQGMAIYEAANTPKAFLELRYGHNEGFILSGETYTTGMDEFLTEFVAARPARPKESEQAKRKPTKTSAEVAKRGSAPAPDSEAAPPPDAETPPDDGVEDLPATEPPILD